MEVELVREILSKECEKHDLNYLGICPNDKIDSIVEKISPLYHGEPGFAENKAMIIAGFYRLIDYEHFVEKRKRISSFSFERSIFFFIKKKVKEWEIQNTAETIDKDLRVKNTLAFLLSQKVFHDIYVSFCRSNTHFETPPSLKGYFEREAGKVFPITFQHLIILLEQNDPEFWNLISELLFLLSKNVTYAKYGTSLNKDIAIDEVVSESYLIIRRKLEQKSVLFSDSLHFRKYLYNICVNKLYDFIRKDKKSITTVSFEELMEIPDKPGDMDIPCEDSDPGISSRETILYSIDVRNPYEVATLIAIVIGDKSHPLHRELLSGNEKKVKLLVDVAVNGLSYDQIIENDYEGNELTRMERTRLNAKLRQDYVRIRKQLVKRMIDLLESFQEKSTKRYSHEKVYG